MTNDLERISQTPASGRYKQAPKTWSRNAGLGVLPKLQFPQV